jgi:ABC-type Fe3+ transport system permease subunit
LFRVRTYAEEIYTEYAVEPSGAPLRLAPQALYLAASFAAAFLAIGRWSRGLRAARTRTPRVWPLRRWRWPLTLLAIAVVAVLVATPLASLAWKAGLVVTFEEGERVRAWSPQKCWQLCAACVTENRREFGWSYGIAAAAAGLAAMIGGWLAWLARRGGWRTGPALVIVAAVWAIPGPLVGMATITAFLEPNLTWLNWLYDRTVAPVLLVQTWKALGVTIPILWFSLRTVSRDQFDLAAVDGLGRWERWRRLAWQPRRAAWIGAWLAGFAVALGDLPATYLVKPPLVDTLPTLIWSRLHTGLDDEAAAICLVQWFACQLLVLAASLPSQEVRPARRSKHNA